MVSLYDSTALGSLTLKNRVFMAPLTRNRAYANGVPGDLAAEYYIQRASAGLIITEATQISPMGKGYIDTPGIHAPEQVEVWKTITDRVHAEQGHIFLQLWHVGRISHTSLLPAGAAPVAPSALTANSQTFIETGFAAVSEPHALSLEAIQLTIADYKVAATHAQAAGFDGVEIHAANGYLIDQFLHDNANVRTDEYGGNAAHRCRFLREVTEAVLAVWDAKQIGVRLSPTGTFNDMHDSNPAQTFGTAIEMLNDYQLGYLHMVEAIQDGRENSAQEKALLDTLRSKWQGFYIANGGYTRERGEHAVSSGYADAVAYGRDFLANPDLPKRLARNLPLNTPDENTFYGGGAEGYTDYPIWEDSQAA